MITLKSGDDQLKFADVRHPTLFPINKLMGNFGGKKTLMFIFHGIYGGDSYE